MTNEEAKFVLHAYRPNGADAGDATFCAALEQAKQDPALEKWFSAQQAFDRAMCAKLSGVTPPDHLRASILAGAKVSEPPAVRSWWHSSVPMALAASIALLLAVGIAFWPTNASAEQIAAFAIKDTLTQSHEGAEGPEALELQAMLTRADRRLSAPMPLDFAALQKNGCRTVRFAGRDLLEVCFKRDGKWFHCYVARAADFPLLAKKLTPSFTERPGASAAAWSDGEHIFVVASKAGRDAIQRLI
ncbi:MAG: hypothetical protein KF715_05730 [Candidatus Didemnitutus sp.]|nr:hypothetical protein [Candidatus Didemnitutus sp.]